MEYFNYLKDIILFLLILNISYQFNRFFVTILHSFYLLSFLNVHDRHFLKCHNGTFLNSIFLNSSCIIHNHIIRLNSLFIIIKIMNFYRFNFKYFKTLHIKEFSIKYIYHKFILNHIFLDNINILKFIFILKFDK